MVAPLPERVSTANEADALRGLLGESSFAEAWGTGTAIGADEALERCLPRQRAVVRPRLSSRRLPA